MGCKLMQKALKIYSSFLSFMTIVFFFKRKVAFKRYKNLKKSLFMPLRANFKLKFMLVRQNNTRLYSCPS